MNQEVARTQHAPIDRAFTVLLSPTRRGARLARLLTAAHLGAWGLPAQAENAAHIVAELAANAMAHGRVKGRDFQLGLAVRNGTLRIEVTDTRGDSVPPGPGAVKPPEDDAETGRGLLIVEALADHWGIAPGPVPRKTVWAEIDLVR
ncbi:ATP-binding protein [Streptomyces griseus]|uniref:Regulatory protein n=1 Tax=Streptomyces griseus subsp. griseus (strain JCM 4626 / CBS 651.72 / NBRC 13350 / KCC S-0626 / ISP 5235) TaxID=455632 RepID=B1VTS1_STRGG|nr:MULTISPECIES: ATP-binding protein [Streptomyces]MYR51987.1 ATP-binding protein [Streptomyces sp. SID4928]EGE43953.1 ATP-binding region ATPase domain protein [Streptomyces sp. ACT-1]MBW3706815.1 ATP-binding protein [Streptomyces griseus]NEB53606.1 ATP-binding protein [Streptomyces griseus]SEE70165.1 Histidine kinase-like ATPase domain-containing protein [Streptomyces griseus]